MSSPIDKKYGDMFIHGYSPDGKVEVILSAHGFELDIGLIPYENAQQLILRWNNLKDHAEELAEKAWRYDELQK